MDDYQKSILKAIDVKINNNNKTLSFDKTYRGIVRSINENLVSVTINGEDYNAKVVKGLTLYSGDVVSITASGNNFSDLIVDNVLNGQGGIIGVQILDSHPNPLIYPVYYNIIDKVLYVWNGTAWNGL
jgi:hypothetical protein